MLKRFFTFLFFIITVAMATAQPQKQAVQFYKAGKKLKDKGYYNEAITAFKKATAFNKKYDSAYVQMGIIYTKISKADSAIIILSNAVKVIPGFAGAYILMGNIYRDYKNNPDEAITNYLNALKTDSINKATYYSLAWCNNAKGNYREAINYGKKSLEIDNNYKPAYNELGHAYRKLNAYTECVEQFKKNLAISINELPLIYSAYSYLELNQKGEALKMYEELKKINEKAAEGVKKKIDEKQ